jgi:phenylacetate-CoA ligase
MEDVLRAARSPGPSEKRQEFGMNLRRSLYFSLMSLAGWKLGQHYRLILDQEGNGIPEDTTRSRLIRLLDHCRRSVPYYAQIMERMDRSFTDDPIRFLEGFPVLTKQVVRERFPDLKSSDLSRRRWFVNTTGGSTGEPVQFIQDRDFAARSGAITLLYSHLAGREIGELEVKLWGSSHDIAGTRRSLRARFVGRLSNSVTLSAFRLTPEQMRDYLSLLNRKRPRLIVAYSDAIYALAKHAERTRTSVSPQNSIIVSAQTLYPYMREAIERVFQCRVYNRYGSRELGDVACERPGVPGLWVAPWGNYVEVVDDEGNRVPPGQDGRILITSLMNFAMPLIRYRIDDRGHLLPGAPGAAGRSGQILGDVAGRTADFFQKMDGTIVHASYFHYLLYFRDWIRKFQVIQKDYCHVVFKFVKSGSDFKPSELEDIRAKTRLVMGRDCRVEIEFVDEIFDTDRGKHRHVISEVSAGLRSNR